MKEVQKWSQSWFHFSRSSQSNYICKALSFVRWNWFNTQNPPWQFISCFPLMSQKDTFLLLKNQVLPKNQELVGLGTQKPHVHTACWLSIHQLKSPLCPFHLFNTYFLDLFCTRPRELSWIRPSRYIGSSGGRWTYKNSWLKYNTPRARRNGWVESQKNTKAPSVCLGNVE